MTSETGNELLSFYVNIGKESDEPCRWKNKGFGI